MPTFIFSCGFKLSPEVFIKFLEKLVLPLIERVAVEDATTGNRILRHAKQAREPSLDCQKISTATSILTPGHPTPHIALLVVIIIIIIIIIITRKRGKGFVVLDKTYHVNHNALEERLNSVNSSLLWLLAFFITL